MILEKLTSRNVGTQLIDYIRSTERILKADVSQSTHELKRLRTSVFITKV